MHTPPHTHTTPGVVKVVAVFSRGCTTRTAGCSIAWHKSPRSTSSSVEQLAQGSTKAAIVAAANHGVTAGGGVTGDIATSERWASGRWARVGCDNASIGWASQWCAAQVVPSRAYNFDMMMMIFIVCDLSQYAVATRKLHSCQRGASVQSKKAIHHTTRWLRCCFFCHSVSFYLSLDVQSQRVGSWEFFCAGVCGQGGWVGINPTSIIVEHHPSSLLVIIDTPPTPRQPSSLPGLVSCAGIVSTATRLARAGGDSSLLVQHAALLALRYPWHHNLLRTVMGVYGTLSAAAYGVAGRKQDTATLLAQPLTPLIEFLSAALVCGSL